MTGLSHVHRGDGSGCRGLESVEDQIFTDVRDVIQASESDLMAGGVAGDLLQMAKRVGPQYEAAEYEDLSGRKVPLWTTSLWTIEGAIEPFVDGTAELSMKAPMSVSKLANLG